MVSAVFVVFERSSWKVLEVELILFNECLLGSIDWIGWLLMYWGIVCLDEIQVALFFGSGFFSYVGLGIPYADNY